MADQLGDEPPPAAIQLARCFGTDIDFRITGCSALIDLGGGTSTDRAEFFISRGSAFLSKGQDNRAVQDFDAAIRLDPDQANAFLHQGALRVGRLGRAVADFEKACSARPELQPCRQSGGLTGADTNSLEKEFMAVLAKTPLSVSPLQCEDITSGTDLPDFRKWFDQFMAPVSHTGLSMDEMYGELLAECTQNQNWSAVDVTRQLRLLMQGLTPQHVGGK